MYLDQYLFADPWTRDAMDGYTGYTVCSCMELTMCLQLRLRFVGGFSSITCEVSIGSRCLLDDGGSGEEWYPSIPTSWISVVGER